MQIEIFERPLSAYPSDVLADDLSDRAEEVAYTHGALWGPLTARVVWGGRPAEAFHAAEQWLGAGVKMRSPDGRPQWNGFVWSVRFSIGGRTRVRSLEGYANYVRCKYEKLDTSVSQPSSLGRFIETATDQPGQAVYGRIEHTFDASRRAQGTAANMAAAELSARKHLLYLPESGALGEMSSGGARIEIEAVGWYRALWYRAVYATTSGTADVRTEIETLLSPFRPWYFPSDSTALQTTGYNVSRVHDEYRTAGEEIKDVLLGAPGFVFGIDLDRVPYLRPHKRAAAEPDYYEHLDGTLEGAGGEAVPAWAVRPDSIVRQVDFVPSGAAPATAVERIENMYLTETTFTQRGEKSRLTYKAASADALGRVRAW